MKSPFHSYGKAFFLYAGDLHHAGYSYADVVRVYALNLLLIPVNLAGVAKSIHQGLFGHKIPFGRTPKVQGRTRIPWPYLAADLVLLAYWSMGCIWDVLASQWGHAAFQAANVALLIYAISRFIGWRQFRSDLRPNGLPLACDKAGAEGPHATSERAAV